MYSDGGNKYSKKKGERPSQGIANRRRRFRIPDCHVEVPQICDELVEYSFSELQPLFHASSAVDSFTYEGLTYCGIMYDDHHVCIPCELV